MNELSLLLSDDQTNIEPGFIYLICAIGTDRYKLGMSKKPGQRLQQLQVGSSHELQLVLTIPTGDMSRLEQLLHKTFKRNRNRGEWFTLSENDVRYLRDLSAMRT